MSTASSMISLLNPPGRWNGNDVQIGNNRVNTRFFDSQSAKWQQFGNIGRIMQRIRANWFVGEPVRSFALLDFEIEGEILDKKMNWCFVIV